jgi:hypothetical protein
VAGQRAQLGVDQRQHVVCRALVALAQAQQALGDRVRLRHGRGRIANGVAFGVREGERP